MSGSEADAGAGVVVFGLAHCDTVRRARSWLARHGIACRFHDFKSAGAPPAELSGWLDDIGASRLINRRGTTWRQLSDAQRLTAEGSPDAVTALLSARPSLIKRPVVRWPDGVLTVGFDPLEFERQAGSVR